MVIVKLILVVTVFVSVWRIVFMPITKLLGIGVPIYLSETEAKNIDKYGTRAIYGVLAFILPVFLLTGIGFRWFMVLVFVMFSTFSAVLEWIYVKETKQYIASILFIPYSIVLILNFDNVLILLFGENVYENL